MKRAGYYLSSMLLAAFFIFGFCGIAEAKASINPPYYVKAAKSGKTLTNTVKAPDLPRTPGVSKNSSGMPLWVILLGILSAGAISLFAVRSMPTDRKRRMESIRRYLSSPSSNIFRVSEREIGRNNIGNIQIIKRFNDLAFLSDLDENQLSPEEAENEDVTVIPAQLLARLSGHRELLCCLADSIKTGYMRYHATVASKKILLPSNGWEELRKSILDRDGGSCALCGAPDDAAKLEAIHIKIRSKGGKDSPENLVTACKGCAGEMSWPQRSKMLEYINKRAPWIIDHHLENKLFEHPLKDMLGPEHLASEKESVADSFINLAKAMARRQAEREASI